ncbi:MAG: winged helix-turn-helix domain-containing protein [Candidatus Acidiferrum sp.]|jgi:DNA-binding winged helix-turn-helix (wHTH) protein
MNAEFARLERSSQQDSEPETVPIQSARYARFGDFCLDLLKHELCKDGARVKMQGKVCDVLLILLETPGDVVTRDALRARLWPPDTRVNYDANVNTTVNKLRQVLGDSSEQSVFVETIPRKGYSFIAPVEYSDIPPTPTHEARKSVSTIPRDASPANGHSDIFSASSISSVWFKAGIIALIAASVLLGAAILLFTHRPF